MRKLQPSPVNSGEGFLFIKDVEFQCREALETPQPADSSNCQAERGAEKRSWKSGRRASEKFSREKIGRGHESEHQRAERATATRRALGNVAYLNAHASGRLLSLHFLGDRDTRKGGGKRGKVGGFSAESRLRMFKAIHRIRRRAALPVFVTLTFPDLFPTFEDARAKLHVLFQRWRRRWPGVSALWRIEAKARQSGAMAGNVAPHFHMLVWGNDFDGEAARLDWFEICGNSEYAHWRYGYDGAQNMKSWEEAAAYCAEYCAKKGNVDAPGRQWGIHNRRALPEDREPVRVRLSWREAFVIKRTIRRAVSGKVGRRVKKAQSLYTPDPESFLRLVAMLRGVNMAARPQQMSRHQHWAAAMRT